MSGSRGCLKRVRQWCIFAKRRSARSGGAASIDSSRGRARPHWSLAPLRRPYSSGAAALASRNYAPPPSGVAAPGRPAAGVARHPLGTAPSGSAAGPPLWSLAISPSSSRQTPRGSPCRPRDDAPWAGLTGPGEQGRRRVRIAHVRFLDKHLAPQAQRVHQHMALTATEVLASVVAAWPAWVRRLDRLAIENGRGGLRLAPCRRAYALASRTVDLFPGTRVAPLPEVVVDGVPLGELVRQEAPPTA